MGVWAYVCASVCVCVRVCMSASGYVLFQRNDIVLSACTACLPACLYSQVMYSVLCPHTPSFLPAVLAFMAVSVWLYATVSGALLCIQACVSASLECACVHLAVRVHVWCAAVNLWSRGNCRGHAEEGRTDREAKEHCTLLA